MDKEYQRVRIACTREQLQERIIWLEQQGIDFGCLSLDLKFDEGNHPKVLRFLEDNEGKNWAAANSWQQSAAERERKVELGQRLITFDLHEDHAVDVALRWNAEILGRPPVMGRFLDIMRDVD